MTNAPLERLKSRLVCAVALATLAAWAPAVAQERAADVDPEKKAYEPIGVALGSFRAFPTLTVYGLYDDNVYNTNVNKDSSFLFRFTPALIIQSDWNRHELKLTTSAEISEYTDATSESRTDFTTRLDGRIDVTRPFRVLLNAGYEVRHEQRGSPDAVGGAAEPTSYDIIPLGIKFDYLASRFGVRVEVGYTDFKWSDTKLTSLPSIDNSDRDRADLTATLKLRYEFSPGYRAFVSATYLDRNYDHTVDRNGQNRDASGAYYDVGVSFELSQLLTGEVFAGYSEFDFDDPSFDSVSGFDYGAALIWYPTELTTVRLDARRSFEATTLVDVGGVYTGVVELSVDHELLRNLVVGAQLSYVDESFEGSGRRDTLYGVKMTGEYKLNRNVALGLRYQYWDRNSDLDVDSFSSNEVGAFLKLSL